MTFVFALLIYITHCVDRPIPLLHGRHLYYVHEDSMGTMGFQPASVIAFFEPACEDSFFSLDFLNTAGLPTRPFLNLGWFDYKTRAEESWLKYENHLDIAKLLNFTGRCPEFVFIPKNFIINPLLAKEMSRVYPEGVDVISEGLERWDPPDGSDHDALKDWIWSHLTVTVTINNNAAEPVLIMAEHDERIIPGGENVSIETYASLHLRIGTQQFIIPHEPDGIDIDIPEDYRASMELELPLFTQDQVGSWDDVLAQRHQFTSFTCSGNFYLPPHLPKFTPSGYRLIDMPSNVSKPLKEWYESHMRNKRLESFFPGYTIINSYTENPSFIDMGQHTAWKIVGPLLESLIAEWSGITELELTSFYGIREYHHGHFLRGHVDRSETHVLSVILHISDSGLTEPWPIEVIGWDGKRHVINMDAEQILFYESAKLVHGRPRYLMGDSFVNCFCHFRPKGSQKHLWGYRSRNDAVYKPDGSLLVDVKMDKISRPLRQAQRSFSKQKTDL